jgi:hypothetical protein
MMGLKWVNKEGMEDKFFQQEVGFCVVQIFLICATLVVKTATTFFANIWVDCLSL